jgi:hypothetical protein
MNKRALHVALAVLALTAAGCAGVTHEQIPQGLLPFVPVGADDATVKTAGAAAESIRAENARQDGKFSGIRYYGTSQYLLVYSDGKGNISWKILELPDQTKLMSARPYNVLARLEVQMTFVNGTLSRTAQLVDGTVVPRQLIETATKFASSLALFDAPAYEVPAPRLYKIVEIPEPPYYAFLGNPELKDRVKVTVPGGGGK